MCKRTLLLPCAGKSTRYPGVRPKWMLTLPDGGLALARATASVAETSYDRAVIAVRADHDEKFGCQALIARVFPNFEVVVLPQDTRGPADTVDQMISRVGISGPIVVKDADSFFAPHPLPEGAFATLCDVRTMAEMSNVGAKSFAVLNDSGLIVQMVEKSLVSNYISIGLYGFPDAALYRDHFKVLASDYGSGEIFLSHVLNRMARQGEPVHSALVEGFTDVGTLAEWRRFTRAHGTLICDIDGVVFQNHSKFFPPYWEDEDKPIEANVAVLRQWQSGGAKIIFMTARPEAWRAKTEAALLAVGLTPFALVMGCPHGRRILVNDHAPSNPYPAAVAINLKRNMPDLPEYLREWL